MSVQIQLRRGTSAQWASADPTLADGELGLDTTVWMFKIGNGSSVWSALSFSINPPNLVKSATDPVSPAPAQGDLYFNTVLDELMQYDGARSKWLSVAQITLTGGRSTDTAAGSFYRGTGNLTFGTNIGYNVPKGTLVGLSWSRTDADAATLEVLVGGSVIATLASSAAGGVSDWTKNADFNAGLLQFRNQAGGNTTTNVMITALLKRRI